MNAFDVQISPIDPLNPGFGYTLTVMKNGETILSTNVDPQTGETLTFAACVTALAGITG